MSSYSHSSTVLGPRRERNRISLVTKSFRQRRRNPIVFEIYGVPRGCLVPPITPFGFRSPGFRDNRPCSLSPTSVVDVSGWWTNGHWCRDTGRAGGVPAAARVCGDVCRTCPPAEGTLADPSRDCRIAGQFSSRDAADWARSEPGIPGVFASAFVLSGVDALVERVSAELCKHRDACGGARAVHGAWFGDGGGFVAAGLRLEIRGAARRGRGSDGRNRSDIHCAEGRLAATDRASSGGRELGQRRHRLAGTPVWTGHPDDGPNSVDCGGGWQAGVFDRRRRIYWTGDRRCDCAVRKVGG